VSHPVQVERFVYADQEFRPTDFAPRDSSVRVWRVSRRPAQLFVVWNRHSADSELEEPVATGVIMWRRERHDDFHRWRAVYTRRYPSWADVRVVLGDVTGDAVPEVLHFDEQGSGACGPHYVVDGLARGGREIFRKYTCESTYELVENRLRLTEPLGPCPHPQGSAHCFGGGQVSVFRWTGTRLTVSAVRRWCFEPNLDPARGCERRDT
jgi:hypothetical protein